VLSPEGKLVNYSVWEINPHQWTIDLDGVKGTYIIIIKTDQGIFRQRVVVI
jgi:hypothetical protein